jgi:TatD DNase family protein
MFIDTHTHIYVKQFDDDRAEMIERAIGEGVETFFLPNIDTDSVERMLKLEQDYPDRCHAMMGLHPCSVGADYAAHLATLKAYFDQRKYVAVGEIGIDLYWEKKFFDQQVLAFKEQIQWAIAADIPIVIHCRDATNEVLQVLEECKHEKLRGIFHCFGGSVSDAEAIIAQGFLLGIGGVLTFKKAGLDKTLLEIGLEHLVLETDSPYLAPVPHRGKRNESSYVRLVAEKLAEIKGIRVEEVARITSENARKVFQMDQLHN